MHRHFVQMPTNSHTAHFYKNSINNSCRCPTRLAKDNHFKCRDMMLPRRALQVTFGNKTIVDVIFVSGPLGMTISIMDIHRFMGRRLLNKKDLRDLYFRHTSRAAFVPTMITSRRLSRTVNFSSNSFGTFDISDVSVYQFSRYARNPFAPVTILSTWS